MPKWDDFGGLADGVFVAMVGEIQKPTTLAITDQNRVDLLAALAKAEHAAASKGTISSIGDYAVTCLDIRAKFDAIKKAGAAVGATDVADLIALLTQLQNLYT